MMTPAEEPLLQIPDGFLVLSQMCQCLGLRKPPISTGLPVGGFPSFISWSEVKVLIILLLTTLLIAESLVTKLHRFLKSSSHRVARSSPRENCSQESRRRYRITTERATDILILWVLKDIEFLAIRTGGLWAKFLLNSAQEHFFF